ncbi:inhibin beta C chain-like isoform X2 [Acanthaster planci]|uniref:Inhibin beta C chain-like isoform X2 n=1 Tax=Acanthaster planci TaxID=133434 RepID=A0A8B7ZKM6_ACAPL|nr:inhibin beta C chain-like isoform X2 [Acanthaster planci]
MSCPSPSSTDSPNPRPTENVIDGLSARERAFRIAMLRMQLQEKLGLTELSPASDKPYRTLPLAIKKRLMDHQPPQRDLPRYERPASQITEVLSYAENYTNDCPEPGFCFRFHLVRDIIGKTVKSVHLWLFLTSSEDFNRSPARRLTIWLLNAKDTGIKREELATKVMSKREGWFHLKLPREKNDWSSTEHRLQLTNAATDFFTDSSQEPLQFPPVSLARDELPVLAVAVDPDKHHQRLRRQSQCQGDSDTCCLQYFEVDLKQVMEATIYRPSTIFANFCRGSCLQVSNFATSHAYVMRNQALAETDDDLRRYLSPCCVPATYEPPVSILYRLTDGTFIQRLVSEISAQTCVCK